MADINYANIQQMMHQLVARGVLILSHAGSPTSGTSGTYVGVAGPGSYLMDYTNKVMYVNTNTMASPTWSQVYPVVAGGITAATITRTQLSAPAGAQAVQTSEKTVTTTGTVDAYIIVPQTGTLADADFSCIDALVASDTNYVTFSITNLGQAGAGSNVMLAATDVNTTKTTGGSALGANTKRALTVNSTAASLAVVKGDRLRCRAIVSGTLGNTLTSSLWMPRFSGTT